MHPSILGRGCGHQEDAMQGYCLKCREQREMKDPQAITMKNGKPATQGACPVCGTKIFKIGKAA
jgi:hypothetical protein